MQGFAEKKVDGGKLVKVQVECGLQIIRCRFFGDFFLHPEETIAFLEQAVQGQSVSFSPLELENELAQVLATHHAELIGATPRDLVTVLKEAIFNAGTK